MEEKKVIKISMSTFFLILSLIAIIAMGIFMYKFYNEKTETTKKSAELQTQGNELSNSESSTSQSTKTDYSKYFGTWSDNNSNEFIVKNIGNDLITFTWFIFRTASIDDVTLPFKDNKAVFYYHGYDDKNYNSKNEDDEFFCRKATVELKENSISIKVEKSTLDQSNENISLDKTDLFGGGVYIQPGEYNFTIKK